MRILGVDYGTRRIGVAVSDESGTIAGPVCVINTRDSLKAGFAPMIKEYSIKKVVIGLPLQFDGSPGPMGEKVEKFAAMLERWFGVETFLWDERYSSLQADSAARKSGSAEDKGNRDMAAATIILQSFLDRNNSDDSKI